MNILNPQDLSLIRCSSAADSTKPVCEVVKDSVPSGQLVDGALLEAAAQWKGFYLLFTTDDVPFEEYLRIHLLDKDLRLLDSATLGNMYSTGSFSLLDCREADTLRFRFIGDTDWSVQVLPKSGYRLPLVSEPTGVSRSLGFRRHFIVRGTPKPGG